jgi:hypothetical protein
VYHRFDGEANQRLRDVQKDRHRFELFERPAHGVDVVA